LNVQKPEDWNQVTTDTVLAEGGSFVNSRYSRSLAKGKEYFTDFYTYFE
jgi:hypothetical protein